MDRIDLSAARWQKSSYSNGTQNCVEVAPGFPGVLPVRDSKRPEGAALIVPAGSWSAFVGAVKGGKFDA
ncbi:DUF397 domain-containing protein [Streptomyces sp. NPDC048644]|uniref:DUF397 domain-containing protein n=1 Tax=Streptomyces sp. NPDC048644 TaxID=3365582 RepID=UPI00371F3CE2